MLDGTPVFVSARDPISHAGLASQLRGRPGHSHAVALCDAAGFHLKTIH
jgi:hypothetical protein